MMGPKLRIDQNRRTKTAFKS